MKPLEQVIEIAGGKIALARKLKISHQAISKWLAGEVPPKRVLTLEELSGGAVTRHELRPDLYPLPEPPIPSSLARRAGQERRAGQDRRRATES